MKWATRTVGAATRSSPKAQPPVTACPSDAAVTASATGATVVCHTKMTPTSMSIGAQITTGA